MVVLAKLSPMIITSYRITPMKDHLIIRSDGSGLSRIRQNPSLLVTVVGDLFRGGDDGSSSTPNHDNQYANQGNYNDSMSSGTQSSENNFNQGIPPSQMQQQVYQQPYAEDGDFSNGMYHNPDESFYGQRESVEDRLAAWRLQQQVCQLFDIPCCFAHIQLFTLLTSLTFPTSITHLKSKCKNHSLQNKQPQQSTNRVVSNYSQPYPASRSHSSSSF
jgi:hypothetical protein